jgi:hypothetical protein
MATHEVHFSIPQRELGKADVEFIVDVDEKRLGTLKISKGSIVWFRGKTHKNGKKISWTQFDDLMEQHAPYRESR